MGTGARLVSASLSRLQDIGRHRESYERSFVSEKSQGRTGTTTRAIEARVMVVHSVYVRDWPKRQDDTSSARKDLTCTPDPRALVWIEAACGARVAGLGSRTVVDRSVRAATTSLMRPLNMDLTAPLWRICVSLQEISCWIVCNVKLHSCGQALALCLVSFPTASRVAERVHDELGKLS